jgi:hypothetical protein
MLTHNDVTRRLIFLAFGPYAEAHAHDQSLWMTSLVWTGHPQMHRIREATTSALELGLCHLTAYTAYGLGVRKRVFACFKWQTKRWNAHSEADIVSGKLGFAYATLGIEEFLRAS